MHYKGVAVLAGIALAAVSLAGCSNTPSGGDSSTLKVAGLGAGDHDALVAVGDAFTKETGIKLDISEDGSANYATTLRTQLGAGTGPDVFFVYPGSGSPGAQKTLAEAGLLEDLSSLGFESKIPPAYVDAATYDDKSYLVPMTQGLIGAIYNDTAMQEAGLTAPTTFSEVLQFCADAKTAGKTAFAQGFLDEFIPQMIPYALTPTLVYGPDPDFAAQQADGSATFADSGWKEAFDEYKQMTDAGCFQPNFQGTSFVDSAGMVGRGESLALVGVNAFLQQIQDAAPDGTTFAIRPLPATDNPDDTRIAAAFAAGYGVNAKAKNKDSAMKFAEYLATPEAQALYAKTAAGLPVFIPEGFEADPVLADMIPYLADNKFSPYPDQGWPNNRVSAVHASALQQLLSGDISVDDALAQMDQAYNSKG
ncbi:ABC transporter substrate-binding protein [Herbiconiux ginsengi]|uniref:Raffinose/stachyose/melibiose transport system substrate-binding protein n=1 Tax=Herbiconiux ginsengi TaxID=381665 RepID=A0A1H3LKL3_9MICO|nr:ABC transporter substrate-binding protein [Herbiconiux ginsengi]SDY64941.1 raffinose/stachyose/melibiose transport system substrate-binding protein [Herbiconiux ginsengi]